VLRTIHAELGQIFITAILTLAFQEGDKIRFELEVERSCPAQAEAQRLENAFTEYVIRTGHRC